MAQLPLKKWQLTEYIRLLGKVALYQLSYARIDLT